LPNHNREPNTGLIIPTFNRPAGIEALLKNLTQCHLPSRVPIYIIENGVPSGVETICNANTVGGRVRYLYVRIAGKSRALNFAIQSATEDFFIFFDDDIIVPNNIVETYVEAGARYGPGHFFGGPWIADTESPCPAWLLPHLTLSQRDWSLGQQEMEVERSQFTFFIGSNWAAFKADLLRAGMFDEDVGVGSGKYSPTHSESEVQHRLIARGARPIYLPHAVIHHRVQNECYTIKWLRNRYVRHGISDWIIWKKYGPVAAFYPENFQTHEFFGIPWGAAKNYAVQSLKQLIADLLLFSLERRTKIKCLKSYWAGWLCGAWTRRKIIRRKMTLTPPI
jgi:glycosyltransferase involved in cell wall biosynthesis